MMSGGVNPSLGNTVQLFSMTDAPLRSTTISWMASGMPRVEPHITRIEPLRPRGLRVRIHLDRGEPFEVTLEALERSRLGSGDELPASRRQRLLDADADVRVRDAALNLLSYRARTRRELQRRLRQKGFHHARIEPCLDRLHERGFLDDRAVAAAFIRDRLRHRPRGSVRLSSELREKGVAADVTEQVIREIFEAEEVSDEILARDVAAGWVARQSEKVTVALANEERGPEQRTAQRRLYGYMARRGFRGEALRSALEEARKLAGG